MIFPDWGEVGAKSAAELPIYTDWAVDWEQGTFALRNGQPYLISGVQALKNWVRCALHGESERYRFSAHSAEYGNCLAELMGEGGDRGILENRLKKEIRETLLVSPYITEVDGFAFTRQGAAVTVRFAVHTLYETLEEEVALA